MNEKQIDKKIYKYFADIVFEKTGIQYQEKDYYRLDSRINTLKTEFNCESSEEVYQKFKTNTTSQMLSFLVDICTNNETYFFRDEKPFDALTQEILPEIFQRNPVGKINIWSCASSTGQEPLSIMMAINEKLKATEAARVEFKATDISKQALEKAKNGIYTGLDVQRGLPIQLLIKYFDSLDDNEWKAKGIIHDQIKYDSFNLLTDLFTPNKFDIIFCRNVLIYQDKDNKNLILDKIHSSLKPGGYLILGAGESLIGSDVKLEQKSLANALVFVKNL